MFKPVPFSSIGMSEARAYDGFSDFSQTPNTQLNFLSIYLDYFSRKFLFCFLCASARYIMNLKYIGAQQQSLLCLRAYSHQWMALMFTIHEFCEMKKNNNNEQRKKTHKPQKPSEIWPETRNCFCKRRKNHSVKEYNVRIYEAWKCNIKSFLASLDTEGTRIHFSYDCAVCVEVSSVF